jgi:acyl carrier protein
VCNRDRCRAEVEQEVEVAMTTLNETIRSVLKTQGRLAVDPETLNDNDDLYRSGLSSHSSVNVMLSLENEFDVEFPDEMLTKATFQSISSVRAALEKLGIKDSG